MGFWKNIQDKAVVDRHFEERLYEAALEEFESGARRRGLWAKAIVEAEGDPARTEAIYLKLLVAALKDEMYIANRSKEIAREQVHSQRAQSPAGTTPIPAALPPPRPHADPKVNRLLSLCHRLRADGLAFDQYQTLAEAVGASLTQKGLFGETYVFRQGEVVKNFNNLPALKPWFVSHVVPAIEATP